MHSGLLALHSIVRWLVLVFIVYSLFRALTGVVKRKAFTSTDNAFRHWTATVAHIQLLIGIILYTQSPAVKYFWANTETAREDMDLVFFSILHIFLMLTATVVLTIGSGLTKRKPTDKEKFKTMLIWFSITLLIILIAIPWPFSPFVNRPYFRHF